MRAAGGPICAEGAEDGGVTQDQINAASYAVQRTLEAIAQGHNPELVRMALEVAFNRVLEPVPTAADVHSAWLKANGVTF